MKTGINQWAFPSDMPAAAALTMARQAGFETFELCVGDEGPVRLDAAEQEVVQLRRHADKLGIQITSAACGMGWEYPLTSPDPTVRARGVEAVERTLHIARWAGADAVLVVPGVVTPEVAYDAAIETALNSVRELRAVAEPLQVSLALENVWNRFLLSPVEFRDFIDQCDSPWVGAYFDIGNAVLYGYPEQWIRILGKRIRKVHAKDFRRAVGNMDGFVMLMEGDVDWPAVTAALQHTGYAGPLTAEYGPYAHSLETMLCHCHASLTAILGKTKK